LESASEHGFASSGWLNSVNQKEHPLNERLSNCFQAILLTEDGAALYREQTKAG
jgi:hypothetical protein